MLKLTGLNKTFFAGTPNEQKALQALDLHLAPGEFVTVVGSNGAGKSTLFNAIAGTFFCESGKILLEDKDITYRPEYKRAREITRIFQDPMRGTAPDLTIEENLALAYSKSLQKHWFSPALNRKTRQFLREQLARLDMGLEDRMKVRIGLLSGGQRQAVTLLMSTLVTPKVLLLDEHTAALDPLTAGKILEITQEIVSQRGITTMMITHNIESALSVGERTIMLDQGRIVLDLQGEERNHMGVSEFMALYRHKCGRELNNDRMLLV